MYYFFCHAQIFFSALGSFFWLEAKTTTIDNQTTECGCAALTLLGLFVEYTWFETRLVTGIRHVYRGFTPSVRTNAGIASCNMPL
jgi:hypothetical protein